MIVMRKTDQPYMTLTWADFYALCERERIKQPLQDGVRKEASGRYQLIVAYGQSVIIVCHDRNFAPAPHWAALQAACRIDTVFEDLVKAVKQDVADMNKLPAEQRGPCKYDYDRRRDEQAIVVCTDKYGNPLPAAGSSIPMAVIFEKAVTGQCIQIRQNLTQRGKNQNITLRWNAEEMSCELIWDGDEDRSLEVWEVSRKALAPLFFDTDQGREDDEGKRAEARPVEWKMPNGFRKV